MRKIEILEKELAKKGYDVKRASDIKEEAIIRTGIFALDYVLSGGIRICNGGHRIEFWGPESTAKCLDGDTLIATKNGLSKIKNIIKNNGIKKENNKLITPIGILESNIVSKELVNKTIKITLENGIELEGTYEHPILSNCGFKKLENISIGEEIYVYKGLDIFRNDYPYLINFIFEPDVCHKKAKHPTKYPKILNNDLAYIIGYYIGDGTLKTNIFQVTFGKTLNGKQMLNYFIDKMKNLFGNCYYNLRKDKYYSLNYPASIRKFFRFLGLEEVSSSNKEIPQCIFETKKEIQASFIKGYLSANGYIDKAGNIIFTSKSKKFINQLQQLLLFLGIESNIKETINKIYNTFYYCLGIYNPFEKLNFAYLIKCNNKSKYKKLFNFCKKSLYKLRYIKNNIEIIHKKVIKKEYLKTNKYVYDFHVPKHHFFIANNLLNHNTTFALITTKEFQTKGKECAFVDAEKAFDPNWADMLGVDIKKLLMIYPNSLEEFGDMVPLLIPKVDLIIVDSIVSLIPEEEINRDTNEPTMGLQPKINSLITRKMYSAYKEQTTTMIFINQVREKIGKYGNPITTAGGRALRHLYSTRIEFKLGAPIEKGTAENKERIGYEIKLNCNKNKKGKAYRKSVVDMYTDGILDNKKSLFHFAMKYSIIKRAGPYYQYGNIRELGKEKILDRIKDWQKIENEIWKAIIGKKND